MDDIIVCEDVSKIYSANEEGSVKALDGISLRIRRGECVAVMGPSGCGKSTLLHLLGALDRPTSGRVLIDGVDVNTIDDDELAEIRGKKIGFVFQFFHLVSTLDALKNVTLPMILSGGKNHKERATKLLTEVGLGKRLHFDPGKLSGGERQRVAIARAMANNPQIILADEPTGNLDSRSGDEIIRLLLKLNKEKNVTLVIITHDREIAKRASKIIRMKDGKITSR